MAQKLAVLCAILLDDVPALIEAGKWDSVRAILIQPPIADVWGKNAKPLLKRYAEAVGNADGDELAAVYNNVFSPVGGDMKVNAKPELVKQYYEMPMQEFGVGEGPRAVKLGAG
ncbi:hypothetical protein JL721_10232 [Aureococcus anophagefferens]|nr:hypothetical protein JL721_10232 [Aureococcus anophagefferens]